MVGVAKSMIKKADNLEDLKNMLQIYNSTPSETSGVSPAAMLMSRRIRTSLPTVRRSEFVPSSTIERAKRRKLDKATQTKRHYDKTANAH